MIFDLHTHTYRSHDGFTRPEELIAACKLRGVDVVAVTEHDRLCTFDIELFESHGIQLVCGCEFTDQLGAHILGLFVQKSLPYGTHAEKILSHIHAEGGFAVMPHPWKPGSGFMAVNGDGNLLSRFHFVELINGGWPAAERACDIVRLANEFGLRMLSSSDSHKACQVGLCCTRIHQDVVSQNAYEVLANSVQERMDLLIDIKLLKSSGRRVSPIQSTNVYQNILPFIPNKIRRTIKVLRYRYGSERFIQPSVFSTVDVSASSW